jgi:hypothetical protein
MKLMMKTVFLVVLSIFMAMHSAVAYDSAMISNPRLPACFLYPTCDGYDGRRPAQISVTYTITNTGDSARSFWMGYSARPYNGVHWLDVPAIRTPVLGRGQSYTGTLTLDFPSNAPTCCWYNIDIGVWLDMASNGLLIGERDHETFYKAFFVTNSMPHGAGDTITCTPVYSDSLGHPPYR